MKTVQSIQALCNDLALKDGASLSFHHHLRNGDGVLNKVLTCIESSGLTNLKLYPSAVFPSYDALTRMVKQGRVASLTTNYINGPLAQVLAREASSCTLTMQSHGGRARAILKGEQTIDVTFVAAPIVDVNGNASGTEGRAACGSLGYAMEDVAMAKTVVLITDTRVDAIAAPQIDGRDVDYVVEVDSIGDAQGILSGTTRITEHPLGVKIAHSAARVIDALDIVKAGFSFQSGAGGISLRVTESIRYMLEAQGTKAAFFSGGITRYHVDMLENGLVDTLYDVQCFDLESVKSIQRNANHIAIGASDYANPDNPNRVIKGLSLVMLGATEFDTDFNVNVITDSFNTIIGGSGGHSDTAEDASISVIATPLIRGRMPVVKSRVTTITTPGKDVDIIVTERGIAVNPARKDLHEKLTSKGIETVSVETLLARAHALTGVPETVDFKGKKIGVVESRHGVVLDTLHAKKE